MIAFACWTLIYLARALEWVRLRWNTALVGDRGLFARWAWTPMAGSSGVHLLTRAGVAIMAPCAWMYPVAVWLTRLANRGLPPIPTDRGFLFRLYP